MQLSGVTREKPEKKFRPNIQLHGRRRQLVTKRRLYDAIYYNIRILTADLRAQQSGGYRFNFRFLSFLPRIGYAAQQYETVDLLASYSI